MSLIKKNPFSSNKLSHTFEVHYEEQLHALKEIGEMMEPIQAIRKFKQHWQKGTIMTIKSLRSVFDDLKSFALFHHDGLFM